MQNRYQTSVNETFRKKVTGWDALPAGDPMKILAEGFSLCLADTEARYRELMENTLAHIPSILGFQRRTARPAQVRLQLSANPKMEAALLLPVGTRVGFRCEERKFEAIFTEAVSLTAGQSQSFLAQWVEVQEEYPLGTLVGENWEELALPLQRSGPVSELALRYPDETVRTLHAISKDELLRSASEKHFENSFFTSVQGVVVPQSSRLCAGYLAKVQVSIPRLELANSLDGLVFSEVKLVSKPTGLAQASLVEVVEEAILAETSEAFLSRFSHVQRHALESFQASPAKCVEEIQSVLESVFPEVTGCEVRMDLERQQLVVDLRKVAMVSDTLQRQVRSLAETKVNLRFEVLVLTGAAFGRVQNA